VPPSPSPRRQLSSLVVYPAQKGCYDAMALAIETDKVYLRCEICKPPVEPRLSTTLWMQLLNLLECDLSCCNVIADGLACSFSRCDGRHILRTCTSIQHSLHSSRVHKIKLRCPSSYCASDHAVMMGKLVLVVLGVKHSMCHSDPKFLLSLVTIGVIGGASKFLYKRCI